MFKIITTKRYNRLLHKEALLQKISEQLFFLTQKTNTIMANLADVQQALTDLQASVDAKQAETIAAINALKDQIANGSAVSPADLDALIATVNTIKGDVDTTDLGS